MDWKVIVDLVRKDFNINISKHQAYGAKKMAMENLEGTTKMQYAKLWDYCEELRRSNPGSTCLLSVDRPQIQMQPIFRSIYVCLKACKDGFLRGCRPIIGLDGCHLKGASHGQLLVAVGIDANDGIFPLALATVDVESKQSWTWFLENLLEDIVSVEQKKWVFMTDQQKGLVPAIEKVAPTAEHRFCLRHLYANFKKHFKGKAYKDALWSAARATTRSKFDKEIKKLAELDKSAFNWINAVPTKFWARHAFRSHSKCDMLSNNLCESFNSYILEARSKPILTMFEVIRKSLMSRVHRKRELMAKWTGKITPKIHLKLEKAKHLSKNWSPRLSGGERFEVEDGKNQYIVDVNTHTCSCYMCELTGIPCPHSIQCIWFMRKGPVDYVHVYFHKQTFEVTYSHYIQPINGVDLWPNTNMEPILPPFIKKLPGRPKKLRRRDPDESSSSTNFSKKYSVMRCSKCGKEGRNVRSCEGQVKGKPSSKLLVKKKQDLMGFGDKQKSSK